MSVSKLTGFVFQFLLASDEDEIKSYSMVKKSNRNRCAFIIFLFFNVISMSSCHYVYACTSEIVMPRIA